MRLVSGLTGTACYELVSSGPDFPDQGMIPNPVVGTQTVGGLNYAFSFYQAPDVYGDTTGMSRQVQVQFVFTPDSGNGDTTSITANLTVVRPPMMLIHGVWGSAGTWDPMIFITNAPSKVFNADYSSTNGASFTTNLPKIQGFVANTLMLSHQAGYAATKADVVAHSMGGILTRLYAASPQYMRPDNFNRGDIHRFITVDTPHGGSSLASMIVALPRCEPRRYRSDHTLSDSCGCLRNRWRNLRFVRKQRGPDGAYLNQSGLAGDHCNRCGSRRARWGEVLWWGRWHG